MAGDQKSSALVFYEIQIAGRLGPEWEAWFEGMQISVLHTTQGGTATILRGSFIDQAALFGALTRIRDLGLKLISVNHIEFERMKEG